MKHLKNLFVIKIGG